MLKVMLSSVSSAASCMADAAVAKMRNRSCCYPESYWSKGIGLVFMCILGSGLYFCKDNPGALEASGLAIL